MSRRRRPARRYTKHNPIDGTTIAILVLGVGAVGLGAYYLLKPAAAASTTPAASSTTPTAAQTAAGVTADHLATIASGTPVQVQSLNLNSTQIQALTPAQTQQLATKTAQNLTSAGGLFTP